ncbi:hypothetical protein HF521_001143 [Silurus meridionalis]|uniref:Uncharacterized protein n=1 Tax=Silurus meridionalis TaxID=175797 RepID=A0A8T0B658_SILME|nr:hypothetical protein HF521_001143 [Silurus meridionalis]
MSEMGSFKKLDDTKFTILKGGPYTPGNSPKNKHAFSPVKKLLESKQGLPHDSELLKIPPVLGELCRIVSKDNTAYIKEVKERWDTFQSLTVFYSIMKKVMKPQMKFNTEERAINMLKSLPRSWDESVRPCFMS